MYIKFVIFIKRFDKVVTRVRLLRKEIDDLVKQRDFVVPQHQQAIKLEEEWNITLESATSEYNEAKKECNIEKITLSELEEKLTQSKRISVKAVDEVLFYFYYKNLEYLYNKIW